MPRASLATAAYAELIDDSLDRRHVVRRIADWKGRIAALFEQVRAAFRGRPEYEFDETTTVEMDEEMMRKHGVAPTTLPVLRIAKAGQPHAVLKPAALWTIGGNGRVDFYSPRHQGLLVDFADHFEAAAWHLVAPTLKSKSRPIDEAMLRRLLA